MRITGKSHMADIPVSDLRPQGTVPRGRFSFQSPMSPQQAVDNWNSNVRVGHPVTYWQCDGYTFDTKTCSEARVQMVNERPMAVIWLYGCTLASLDRVLMI